ncbi:helix-turn-helix transcriptional regulator [Pseudomonas sp. PDM11]|uniref:helix-turn-helix transcriptional regulator n=1 Tax=Pseudomonas sp. PDM11 TaxID=2769309 RepID=UPI00177F58A6|nr:AlpA family transcriptional regulator [Pseudomonas sp. PDM11]MBD9400085.1 AlpA family transcriptional regulator [Pseudomonas sp. PDM11]
MRIIRLKEVTNSTGLARSTVYKFIAEGTFPKPVPLGDRCVGWVEEEVHDWIMVRIEARDLAAGAGQPVAI